MEPIRIFIGCSANDEDLEFQSVLHYSLERKASAPLDITWMRLSRDPDSFWYSDPQSHRGWATKTWHTPFSALRWGIPAYCNFTGKAIYMDLDMIAMADIAELWNHEFNDDAAMISKVPAICVTLYDCERMKSELPPIHLIRTERGLYRQIRNRVTQKPRLVQPYVGNWNCLDLKRDKGGEYGSIHDPDIKVLHFTNVATQPHLRHAIPRLKAEGRKHWYANNTEAAARPIHDHPRKDALVLFDKLLEEAQANGYGIERYRNPEGLFGDYGRN